MLNRFSQAVRRGLLTGTSVVLLIANVAIVSFAALELSVFQTSYVNAETIAIHMVAAHPSAEREPAFALISSPAMKYIWARIIRVKSVSDQMRVLRLLPLNEIQRAQPRNSRP